MTKQPIKKPPHPKEVLRKFNPLDAGVPEGEDPRDVVHAFYRIGEKVALIREGHTLSDDEVNDFYRALDVVTERGSELNTKLHHTAEVMIEAAESPSGVEKSSAEVNFRAYLDDAIRLFTRAIDPWSHTSETGHRYT